MGEIDDVEHAEDHRETEAQQRIERAVDQSDQQLRGQGLQIDRHGALDFNQGGRARRLGAGGQPAGYFFTSAQVLLSSGVKAWSPGTVPTSL